MGYWLILVDPIRRKNLVAISVDLMDRARGLPFETPAGKRPHPPAQESRRDVLEPTNHGFPLGTAQTSKDPSSGNAAERLRRHDGQKSRQRPESLPRLGSPPAAPDPKDAIARNPSAHFESHHPSKGCTAQKPARGWVYGPGHPAGKGTQGFDSTGRLPGQNLQVGECSPLRPEQPCVRPQGRRRTSLAREIPTTFNEAPRRHKDMSDTLSAGILAGGESKRMGRDKALLELGGKPLIAAQVEILSGVADEVLIASGRTRRYAGLGARVVLDRLQPGCALAGVHALLDAAKSEAVFICACDHACLNPALIQHLVANLGSREAVVPVGARGAEPLYGVYTRRCLRAIRSAFEKRDLAVVDLPGAVDALLLRVTEEEWLVQGESPFTNVNTPGDFDRLRQKRATRGA